MESYIDDIIVGIIIILFLAGYFSIKLKKGYTNRFRIIRNTDKTVHKQILSKYFSYYNLLSERDKKKFLRRVGYFISMKEFLAVDFEKVSDEMKVLISASAIQLTFGLPEIYLSNFENIRIFAGDFNEKHTPEEKTICINWEKFFQGYLQPSASYNYGLHEMAKTLQVENNIMNEEYGFLNEPDLESWVKLSEQVLQNIKKGDNTFFTEFKSGEREDLFPVVVESFFEKPVEFHNEYPSLYSTISGLLNQSPLKLFDVSELKTQA
ncbi:MAG: zinc-dependent peptidase [Bacteroidota bacterium]